MVIIQYNAGNIQSVLFALERLGVHAEVTDDAEKIRAADRIIFPGVGEAGSAMHYLKQRGLDIIIKELKQPVLGICLGMQLLALHSEESETDCLGIIPVRVRQFQAREACKVPQIGWNRLYGLSSPIFENVPENSFVYNVHSYYAEHSAYTIARCDYILEYAAAFRKDNFFGVQFHVEKSAAVGEQILKNFLSLP